MKMCLKPRHHLENGTRPRLDAGPLFEILSIDIADINVGKNIGAELQAEQAEADLVVAQAKAEERRAMAVARKQEMTANVQEIGQKSLNQKQGCLVPLQMRSVRQL